MNRSAKQVQRVSPNRAVGRNIGRRASASFLVGSYRLVRQEGILEAVGTDYLVLRQGNFSTGCDLYALKFIEFHDDPPA